MTDTGQVPGEGLPENAGGRLGHPHPADVHAPPADAGYIEQPQPGVPSGAAYTFLDGSEHVGEEDDLLLMPGAQGAWSEQQAQYQTGAYEAGVLDPAAYAETQMPEPQPVAEQPVPQPAPAPAPAAYATPTAPARRPLHMGPPVPDTSNGVVRSLADRGPAAGRHAAPVRQPEPQPQPQAAPEPQVSPEQQAVPEAPEPRIAPEPQPQVPHQVASPPEALPEPQPEYGAGAPQGVPAPEQGGMPEQRFAGPEQFVMPEQPFAAPEQFVAPEQQPVMPEQQPVMPEQPLAADYSTAPQYAAGPQYFTPQPDDPSRLPGPQLADLSQLVDAPPPGDAWDSTPPVRQAAPVETGAPAEGPQVAEVPEAEPAPEQFAQPEAVATEAVAPEAQPVAMDQGYVDPAVADPAVADPAVADPHQTGATIPAQAGAPVVEPAPQAAVAEEQVVEIPAQAQAEPVTEQPGAQAVPAPVVEAAPEIPAQLAHEPIAIEEPPAPAAEAPAQEAPAQEAAAQQLPEQPAETVEQPAVDPGHSIVAEDETPQPEESAAEEPAAEAPQQEAPAEPQADAVAEAEAAPEAEAATPEEPAEEQAAAEAPEEAAAEPEPEPTAAEAETPETAAEAVAEEPSPEEQAPEAEAADIPDAEAAASEAPEAEAPETAEAEAPPVEPEAEAVAEAAPEAGTEATESTAEAEAGAETQPAEPEATAPEMAPEGEAAEPETAEPEATEPDSQTTEQDATEPESDAPEATEPEAGATEPTEPEAETAEPETTDPEAAALEATEPETGPSEAGDAEAADAEAVAPEPEPEPESEPETAPENATPEVAPKDAAEPEPEPETEPESQTDPDPDPEPEAVPIPLGPRAEGYDEAERAAVHRVMRERRDIRNGFRPDPIPHEVLLRVLEAAHTAPSVGHSQPWDFVVIRSEETRRAMHELAMRQRDAYAKSLPKGRAKQFKELKIEAILETPVNIVVTADPTRGGRHTLGRHTQPQMAPYSSALAVENLWLAARAEGLGVGWVSFFDEREMVRELGLPEHLEVVAYLCVGYVDEFPEEPELMKAGWSKRRPLSWVVHEEAYGRRTLPGGDPHNLLQETLRGIRPLDAKALGEAWERQKRMTKPSGALGMLEIISAQLSGLSRQCPPPIPEPASVAIFAGDHGVHAQGVTAWPQEVTAQMVANFLGGGAVCNAFAGQVGAEVCVVDVGVASDLPSTPGLLPRKVRAGTGDFTIGPALTREEVLRAIEVGIETARDLVAAGNKALLTGEMGIANTTVSAALVAIYTGADPAEVTGRGTGINDEMHARKIDVVRRGLELHQPDAADPIGVLSAFGGLEHAAIAGLLLGGASLRTPVILDGVSAGAAALVARAIAPEVLAACIAGHRSAEPGHVAALNKLGLRPLVDLDLRLGEGTGALLALPVVQSAARAMHEVATFDSAGVTEKN
ncbi:nicotinate-nucleotide--dimethylbenzimidazole phosphoribosyltransferase [Streptomyces sp. 5-10]|uniref:nicotinate-nucleotide--dimethylbenzimidazole phosphoribosyltransferase n=1 Tax=Streptomyces sp. 5-10 TaxID=878925 RepID=UPI00168BC485|nr:nicotinate-nucleotide--dimethylbenzimidazole phosphoribosyltransferase [Streptomyces sp. 5-10]MBD3006501.1 nicotinate-nucleotide--dimethylbenzimidazole phosphoribosyltransferase [Streptomyces sp. 5-10]